MPSKYLIHTRPVPNRFETITKSGIIAWEEGCLKCPVCVKKKCVYEVYDNRMLDSRQMIESIDNQCRNCLRCVQNCPKELIHKSLNPEFGSLGDSHWTPDIIARLWYQAENGKIPVSGAGYPGPFSGPGFDSMWTDMSEIVRPTRDGIHGREYISTAVDLGRTSKNLMFNDKGDLRNDMFLIDLPLPLIMRLPSFGAVTEETLRGWATAAAHLDIMFAVPVEIFKNELAGFKSTLLPVASSKSEPEYLGHEVRLIEIIWEKGCEDFVREMKALHPSSLISIRLPLFSDVGRIILPLIEMDISIFHLEGSFMGMTFDREPLHVKDGLRNAHLELVSHGIRDEITLLASGGISMAEHVPKAVICGADAVVIDFPILIALECRMCHRCEQGIACPVDIGEATSKWVSLRTINLMGAWHNQLLEVMGAMGIRDVRRLRGEAGRAIFFEELDKTMFGSLSKVKEGCELE